MFRLPALAEQETRTGEANIDFQLGFPTRDVTGEYTRPSHQSWDRSRRRHHPDEALPTRPVDGDDELDRSS